jgi:hypothetical protein
MKKKTMDGETTASYIHCVSKRPREADETDYKEQGKHTPK